MGFENVVVKTRAELDLTVQEHVSRFFDEYRPEYVFLAAGKTGGVYANDTYRAEFFYENLSIQTNVIHQAYLHEVKKLSNIFFYQTSIFLLSTPMK